MNRIIKKCIFVIWIGVVMVDLSGCTFEKNDDFAKNMLEE